MTWNVRWVSVERQRGALLGRAVAFAAVVVLSLAATPSEVFASGGKDIATGPVVVAGQLQSGNTATDGGADAGSLGLNGHCSHATTNSWWNLPVTAGDTVTIDWQAPHDHFIDVFPVGTTDYTQPTTTVVVTSKVAANGKDELVFTASTSGTMPIVFGESSCFSNGDPGPFSFTAFIAHPAAAPAPTPPPAPATTPPSGPSRACLNARASVTSWSRSVSRVRRQLRRVHTRAAKKLLRKRLASRSRALARARDSVTIHC